MNNSITLTETKLTKNPHTKTTYIEQSKEVKEITEREHGLLTSDDTCKWFRRLGGVESKQMAYTKHGYLCNKLVSTSPDKKSKTVREFQFK